MTKYEQDLIYKTLPNLANAINNLNQTMNKNNADEFRKFKALTEKTLNLNKIVDDLADAKDDFTLNFIINHYDFCSSYVNHKITNKTH